MKPFDHTGNFQVSPQEVSRLAVRGAGATLLSSGSGLIIQIGSTVILARLLLPSDFGLVAMVTTFSLLALNFGLNGITEAILQAEEITDQIASNLFWMNIGGGALLTLGLAALGTQLAKFYGDQRVTHVAYGVSLSILLTSSSVVHLALLSRAMRFSWVSANDVVARISSTLVALLLAWMRWGYWALVIAAVFLPLSTTLGAWTLCRWLPKMPRRAAGTGSIVRFALHTYSRFSLNYFARNIDNLLVGWRFGAVSLGFYKKAYDLFATPVAQSTGPLTNVALAGLSRFRGEPAQYRRNLLNAMSILAFVGMGMSALLSVGGRDLIRVLLGAKWGPAGIIFTLFGPGVGMMVLYQAHVWIHFSIGRADRALRWGFIELAITVLFFLAGLHWGPIGVAAAWTLSSTVLIVPAFWYAGRPIRLEVIPFVETIWRYVAAAAVAGFVTALICKSTHLLFDGQGLMSALIRLIIESLLVVVIYLATVVLLHGGFTPLSRVLALLRQMVPFKSRERTAEKETENMGPALELSATGRPIGRK